MPRLTRDVRQRILDQNEGFTTNTFYKGKNSREERTYTVLGGKLHIHAVGKSSWADSHYNNEWTATDEETHRFLYEHQYEMNLDGIE